MISLSPQPLDASAVRAAVAHPSCGALLVFEGTARDSFDGRAVLALTYEAWEGPALAEMTAIATELVEEFPGVRVAMAHRTGLVPIGDPTVVIAVAAPHRAACYEASRAAIDRLKLRVPIWKKEIYEDGSAWKANTPANDG